MYKMDQSLRNHHGRFQRSRELSLHVCAILTSNLTILRSSKWLVGMVILPGKWPDWTKPRIMARTPLEISKKNSNWASARRNLSPLSGNRTSTAGIIPQAVAMGLYRMAHCRAHLVEQEMGQEHMKIQSHCQGQGLDQDLALDLDQECIQELTARNLSLICSIVWLWHLQLLLLDKTKGECTFNHQCVQFNIKIKCL